MTEQNTSEVTDDERVLAREWAKSVKADPECWGLQQRTAARVILDAVPAPSMAEMTEEERAACRWMQCDAGPYGRRGLIIDTGEWAVYVADKETGTHSNYSPDLVTALPDLPRMEWNGTEKDEDVPTVEVGDIVESADDPRLEALPTGSVLLDRDGVTATKQREGWTGFGYVPIKSQGDEYGPWTVRRIGLVADQ